MYSIKQLKNQFKIQFVSYAGPETGADVVDIPTPDTPETASPREIADRAATVTGSLDTAVDDEVGRGLLVEGEPNRLNPDSTIPSTMWVGDPSENPLLVADDDTEYTIPEGTEIPGEGEEPIELTEEQQERQEALDTILGGEQFEGLTPEARQLLEERLVNGEIELQEGETLEEAMARLAKEALQSPDGLRAQGLTELADMNEGMDPEMYNGLLEEYGQERLAAIAEIYAQIASEEGFVAPETAEEFNEMIVARIAENMAAGIAGDAEDGEELGDTEVVQDAAREMVAGFAPASAGQLGAYAGGQGSAPDYSSSAPNLTPGEADPGDVNLLNEAIANAPTEQARVLLETAQEFLGMTETGNREELQQFLGFDPVATPWCKGFTNKVAERAGISLNSSGSLFSLDGVNDGRRLREDEEPLPGDVVMVRRNSGGHIGFYLGTSPAGYPVIIGGNQSNAVTIAEERRELVGINRIAGEPSEVPSET